jgi:hypothetical protein
MSSNKPDSGQSAVDKLDARRLKLRKEIFGAPVDWDKVIPRNAPKSREIDGMSFNFGDEVISAEATPLDPADDSPLAVAIRTQWPDSKAAYQGMVARRYREFYKAIPEDDAVAAVRAGYSSPDHAMKAHVIKKRKYIGQKSERES